MEEFKQFKLSKTEWVSIEKKLDHKELNIVQLIKDGFNDIHIQKNEAITMTQCIKIENKDPDYYIYSLLLLPLLKKQNIADQHVKPPKQKLNNADKIRIENLRNIETTIEYVVLENYNRLVKRNKVIYYYNIRYLLKKYTDINVYFSKAMIHALQSFHFHPSDVLKQCSSVIENNPIFEYTPTQLYQHQKDIYARIQANERCIVFYTTPTSSGKTLTPIGLCQGFKVIFVCASRHIGVNLAKSAINVGVKTGFAFGCSSAADVRLHYFSVHRFTPQKKPIHSDGSKLELLITDIHSYEIAMRYMLVHFDKERVVVFWDEPTISMDYPEHSLHKPLANIWRINEIPRLILSSATLPAGLDPIVANFKSKFEGAVFHRIETTDHTTNIVLMDSDNHILMPHNYFETIEEIRSFVESRGDSYLKFLSINECAKYILESDALPEFDRWSLDAVDAYSIKKFYYKVICDKLRKTDCCTSYDNSVLFTTRSASSITNGPALWLVKDPDLYTTELIQQIHIQPSVLEELASKIKFNFELTDLLTKHKKDYQDKIAKDIHNEKKLKNLRFEPDVLLLIETIERLEKSYKRIQLDPLYIPNTYEHFTRWGVGAYQSSNVYKGNIEEEYANRIMNTSAEFKYKVLLLMGIGVLHQTDPDFNDIMKELADTKQLMLILATSDYIYGTNYQFSHGYLSEDIDRITQEKIIQAIGRVGRKEKNKTFTFRFRDKKYTKLFFEEGPSAEGAKMNALFT